jgi:hypothetical protein
MAFALNRKLWRNLQDYGLRATLHKGAAYVVKPVWSTRVYRIYRKDLSDASPGEAPEVPGLTFRILYRRLYGGTLRSNVASLGLARKVGCREIVDIRHLRLLGQGTWRYPSGKEMLIINDATEP